VRTDEHCLVANQLYHPPSGLGHDVERERLKPPQELAEFYGVQLMSQLSEADEVYEADRQ
jgi:hypothetical protein